MTTIKVTDLATGNIKVETTMQHLQGAMVVFQSKLKSSVARVKDNTIYANVCNRQVKLEFF